MTEKQYWQEDVETQPREQLERRQLADLKEIVAFAYENSPYYRRSFDAAGVGPGDIQTLADIQKFPFINKQTERETKGIGSFIGELGAVPEEDIVFVSSSSGSTGVPTVSPFTKADMDEWLNVESRLFYQIGMRKTSRYMHSCNFSLYVGGPCVIGAENIGALCIWAGTLPSARLLFVLQEFQPTIIQTTPSYAWYLGETALKNGIDPKKDLSVERIIVSGEPGGSISATNSAIEELWGAKVYDFYGISDIFGACAAMCDAHAGLHLAEDQILVETVDPKTGEVIPDGQTGELVFTALRKRARPMIRFRTGDIGYVNKDRCECGRTLARINVLGRKDDMFIVSGVNIFPSDVEKVVRDFDGINGEYLIRVYEEDYTDRYGVEVERDPESTESDESISQRLIAALKGRIGAKPRYVKVLETGALPRQTHKAKRLVDERKKPEAVAGAIS